MPEADCSRILVTNIALTTTEDAIRDFFAFCGDILELELYRIGEGDSLTQSQTKEAVIKFDSVGAASTACLLNNALIDGHNVTVVLFSSPDKEKHTLGGQRKSPSIRGDGRQHQQPATNASTSSFSSIMGNISASSLALASSMVSSVKSVNEKYKVTETVSTGASSAWRESKRMASDLNTRYKIKENVAAAAQTTKEKVSSLASSVSKNESSAKK